MNSGLPVPSMLTHVTPTVSSSLRVVCKRRLPFEDQSLGHHSSGSFSSVELFVANSYTRYAEPRVPSSLSPCSQIKIRLLSPDQSGKKLDPVVPQTRGTVVRS